MAVVYMDIVMLNLFYCIFFNFQNVNPSFLNNTFCSCIYIYTYIYIYVCVVKIVLSSSCTGKIDLKKLWLCSCDEAHTPC